MAVKSINRFSTAFGLLFFPALLLAGGLPNSEPAALALAREGFESAKTALEQKIIECDKQKLVVPPELFERVSLTKHELDVALFVLEERAEDACEGDLRGKLVVAASVYRATAKHFHREPTGAEPYSEDMLFGRSWKRMEFEAEYAAIEPKQREALESIPELRKPFHLFRTLENLGAKLN